MSRLMIYREQSPKSPSARHRRRPHRWPQHSRRSACASSAGRRPEPLTREMDDRAVMQAYQSDIERLKAECGYQSVDVLRCLPDNPKREELRRKFLDEHTHAEDEVRFFVEGAGVFYLRAGGKVHMTLLRARRLDQRAGRHAALVRHGTGARTSPRSGCSRPPTGWVAQFTGEPIARSIPSFEQVHRVIRLRACPRGLDRYRGHYDGAGVRESSLFPYARRSRRLCALPRKRARRAPRRDAHAAGRRPLSTEELIACLLRWIDEDRKVTPLKSLQGRIWRPATRAASSRPRLRGRGSRATQLARPPACESTSTLPAPSRRSNCCSRTAGR